MRKLMDVESCRGRARFGRLLRQVPSYDELTTWWVGALSLVAIGYADSACHRANRVIRRPRTISRNAAS